jgi:signal transduction histidine kinase
MSAERITQTARDLAQSSAAPPADDRDPVSAEPSSRPAAGDPLAAQLLGDPALESAEQRLHRVNDELSLLYAVEQQIADAHELPTLIAQVLARVHGILRFEAVAVLWVSEAGADVYAIAGALPAGPRRIGRRDALRLMALSRTPARRRYEGAANSNSDALIQLPGARALDIFSVPLSDGRHQLGMLQAMNPADSGEDEESALRRLGLVANQLGRAIVVRREREAFERSERMALIGHSVGALLHDMRSPLTAVAGYIDLMANEEAGAVRADHAGQAGRALEDAQRMLQEVLAFARGQREVLPRGVQLLRFTAEVRAMLQPELERYAAELEVIAHYDGAARFDEIKLKRVLWNLARNACEAGARKFTWRVSRSASHLVFECGDDGPGIPKEMQGRLFESFATHGKAEGTGLGLAMAKKIIDAHCGRIHVKSEAGRGSVFRIELPI